MQTNINGALTVTAYSKKSTDTFNNSIATSGSNFVSDTVTINTSSWFPIPTGSNKDFLVAQFTNNDLVDNIYIALGQQSDFASILTPNSPMCLLSYSGSIQAYAHLSGSNGTASFDYTIVSYL